MKVIIAGGRDFTDYEAVCDAVIDSGFLPTEIVSGAARGADTLGEKYAYDKGLRLARFPADWDKIGRAAGILRNQEMADYADALIAMPGGKGTENMIFEARKRGLKVFVFGATDD